MLLVLNGGHNHKVVTYPKTWQWRKLLLEHDEIVPPEENVRWSFSRSLCETVCPLEQAVDPAIMWPHIDWDSNPENALNIYSSITVHYMKWEASFYELQQLSRCPSIVWTHIWYHNFVLKCGASIKMCYTKSSRNTLGKCEANSRGDKARFSLRTENFLLATPSKNLWRSPFSPEIEL